MLWIFAEWQPLKGRYETPWRGYPVLDWQALEFSRFWLACFVTAFEMTAQHSITRPRHSLVSLPYLYIPLIFIQEPSLTDNRSKFGDAVVEVLGNVFSSLHYWLSYLPTTLNKSRRIWSSIRCSKATLLATTESRFPRGDSVTSWTVIDEVVTVSTLTEKLKSLYVDLL